jgi:CheY-like chemotaxis protein
MDVWLPGIDGWEATKRLRRDLRTAWIPILAVTAHAMAGAKERARTCGCDDYLAKPGRRAAAPGEGPRMGRARPDAPVTVAALRGYRRNPATVAERVGGQDVRP